MRWTVASICGEMLAKGEDELRTGDYFAERK